ncbi:MAG: IS200/IS605 family transposase [Xenococcus sp. (in: cyanobacteria)]
MTRLFNNQIISKFLTKATTEKLLLVTTALLILLSSVYLISKSLAVNFEQYQQYRNAIIELRELDSTFNQEILKSRYELFADYDLLVKSLEDQQQIANKLENIPNLGSSAPQQTIEPILGEIRNLLTTRESLSERFKSRNALLKNSLRYLPLLTSQLETKFTTQTQAEILTRDQISELRSTLNSLIRNLLLYNIAVDEKLTSQISALIQKLDQLNLQYELTQEQFPTELVKSHANIILNTKPQVEQLTTQLLQPLDQYTKSLETTIDSSYKQAAQRVNLYRILTCVWLLMLLIFVNHFLLQRIHQINPSLSRYKKKIGKLTNLLADMSQNQKSSPETVNFSALTHSSSSNLPVTISAPSDTNLAPIGISPSANSDSELVDLADQTDELGQLARRVQEILLQRVISEQTAANQQSFASLTARLTLVTHNRKKMISPKTIEQLKNIFNQALEEWECQLIKVQGSLEQVEILFSYPPQTQLVQLIAHLKAVSSSYLLRSLGDLLKNQDGEEQIWSNSYSLQSCEVPNKITTE